MIIPTILEKDFEEVKRKIKLVEEFVPMIQIDFADGVSVEGETFLDFEKLNEISTDCVYDIDLMVKDPMIYLSTKITNAEKVCARVEEDEDIEEFIKKAKSMGYKVGLSVSPGTEISKLDSFVKEIDFVQFTSVVPGAQGRSFEDSVVKNIRTFHKNYPDLPIQVDGGLNENTLPLLKGAGVKDFIIGSAIFGALNPKEKYIELEKHV